MSCIYKGEVVETALSKNAKGGTEMMRDRLLRNLPNDLLQNYAIHLSRPREIYSDVKNILWCHDLAEDPENKILQDGGWKKFDFFVFVSQWQRDSYINMFSIPYDKSLIIPNAVEVEHKQRQKDNTTIKFIYHTTPHRGLGLAYTVFDALSKQYENIEFDVFSSFAVYGWQSRDAKFEPLFDKLREHPKINYHGAKDNGTVLGYLEKSHVFLYPRIWKETSCIAMIEALRSSCVVINPNYGALNETSENMSISYDFTEDMNKHAQKCYGITRWLLSQEQRQQGFINNIGNRENQSLSKNNISSFSKKWTNLLETLKNS